MSRVLFDFFNESLLSDDASLADGFNSHSADRVIAELAAYREHILKGREQTLRLYEADQRSGPGAYVGVAASGAVKRKTLRRMALYFDRAVVDDPLFRLTAPRSDAGDAFSQLAGFPTSASLDVEAVAEAGRFLLAVRPLVAAGFLHIVPAGLANEAPSEMPVTCSTEFAGM